MNQAISSKSGHSAVQASGPTSATGIYDASDISALCNLWISSPAEHFRKDPPGYLSQVLHVAAGFNLFTAFNRSDYDEKRDYVKSFMRWHFGRLVKRATSHVDEKTNGRLPATPFDMARSLSYFHFRMRTNLEIPPLDDTVRKLLRNAVSAQLTAAMIVVLAESAEQVGINAMNGRKSRPHLVKLLSDHCAVLSALAINHSHDSVLLRASRLIRGNRRVCVHIRAAVNMAMFLRRLDGEVGEIVPKLED